MDDFDVVIKHIDEKIAQLHEFVGTGNFENLADYKKTCGEIRGLLTARGFVLDQKERMEKFNE